MGNVGGNQAQSGAQLFNKGKVMGDIVEKLRRSAIWYHNEGACVIPIEPGEKKPAIDWEKYHTEKSTLREIKDWWSKAPYNIGIVHGEVSGGLVSIDIDHDNGIFDSLACKFPQLVAGRIEQSGSQEGYHIPLLLGELPDFGLDARQQRQKGNKTWRTPLGAVNIRAQFCQTVVPPSIHPSGNSYKFIRKGQVTRVRNLDNLISWLTDLLPKSAKQVERKARKTGSTPPAGDTLIKTALSSWTTPDIFAHFGVTGDIRREANGDIRILGNGGLLINPDTSDWYLFEADEGGGQIEAWAYLTFGAAEHKHRHLRAILLDMVYSAGGDVARFYRPGDEKLIDISTPQIEPMWSNKYKTAWSPA